MGQIVLSVNITAPIMFGRRHVLPFVAEFLAAFREIYIRLQLGDRHVDHVDMAVRFGRLPDSSMAATAIGDMRMVTCANPVILERYGMPERPDDLLHYPCVMVKIPLPSPAWRYRQRFGSRHDGVPV